MDFKDQIVLVSGASRGLGFHIAHALGAKGAHVLALARTVGGLEELDNAIKADSGRGATLIPLDITDDPALARLGAAVHERWGRLDLWVHLAAHAPPLSPVEHIAPGDLDQCLGVNIRAYQRLIRVLDPLLRLAPEPMALIATDDHTDQKFFGTYAMTKAAQSVITRAWAQESARRITIAEFIPPMPTALRARFFPGEDRSALNPPKDVACALMVRLAQKRPIPGERIMLSPPDGGAA